MLGILDKDGIGKVWKLGLCDGMMFGIFDKEGIEEPLGLGLDDG